MLPALLCLVLLQEGQPKKAAPAAADVVRVEAALDEAFRSGEAKGIQAALEAAQDVPHPAIVRKVSRALEDERPEVKLVALQVLRWMDLREALESLQRAAKDRKLMKSPELALAVLRGMGEHADPSSIEFLAKDPFQPEDAACIRARLFGLARVRTVAAIDALYGILATAAPGSSQRRIQAQLGDVRIALMMVTGTDQGASPELWEAWWRENKKTFRVPDVPPQLPREMSMEWNLFWGLPNVYERSGRREDRGQDPPAPRKE